MQPLDWQFRTHIHRFSEAHLKTFLCLYLHSNLRSRTYPGYDLIAEETGLTHKSIANGVKWAQTESLMIARVAYIHRIEDEAKLPPSKAVWQLTGIMLFEGQVYPYLYLNPEGWEGVRNQLSALGNSIPGIELILSSVNSFLGKPKGTKVNAMNKEKGTKPQIRARETRFEKGWRIYGNLAKELLALWGFDLAFMPADNMTELEREPYVETAQAIHALPITDYLAYKKWLFEYFEREGWSAKPTVRSMAKYATAYLLDAKKREESAAEHERQLREYNERHGIKENGG